ncbi:MAG: glycoside hydrolase family 88 protein [Flavobacteriaceae bacterium]
MNTLNLIKNHKGKLIPLFFSFFKPANTAVLFRNFWSISNGPKWNDYVHKNKLTYDSLIKKALQWIKNSQDKVGSGGVGCYEYYRWTTGYPEVTGYIIPTMLETAHYFSDENLKKRAIRMADWELKIQREDGGWEGQYEGDKKPSVVFNTGQVIRGMISSYKETNNEIYLDAAKSAADWIVNTQDKDGSWTSTNFKQMKRVYDSYVTAPLSELYLITNDKKYEESCRKNCEFVLANQHKNGWFEKADNTLLNNAAPILHTIAYTIDGLIETGLNLKEDRYIKAGKLAADHLLHKTEITNILPARFYKSWKKGANYSCLTGNAQLGIIFFRLYELTNDKRYVNAALKLADFLAYTQDLNSIGKYRNGAITGSYPIWGMYCPLKYPSWATKYYIDLLMLIKKYTNLD